MAWESGVTTEPCSAGTLDVTTIQDGYYIEVKGADFGSGASAFNACIASAGDGGNIELHLDSLDGPQIGTCAITSTGGWQTWAGKSCPINKAEGIHDLYFKFTGGSGPLFNFDWWAFKQ